MAWFPAFIDLTGKHVLIVGGGKTARHKVEALRPYGADLHVIAPEITFSCPEPCERRTVAQADIAQSDLVICAADAKTNQAVAQWCHEAKVLYNVVDDAQQSGFIFGANLLEGDLSIGVSTSGASPYGAAEIRNEIRKSLPDCLPAILNDLYAWRSQVKETVPQQHKRAEIFLQAWKLAMKQQAPLSQEQKDALLA